MDSRYRKFLALAETRSFSAAARRMHVTQPAISLAVASLEHGLGVRLYVRRKKPITLTAQGRIVADVAREMAVVTEKMRETLKTSIDEVCHVGLIDSVAHLLYSSDSARTVLAGLEVMVDNSRLILRDLADGKIDLGVITGQPKVLGGGLVSRKLGDEEFIFVAAPEQVPEGVIDRIDDWLATNRESTTYQHFLRLFRRRHLQVTPIFHSASMELLRDMAVSGKGTALLPRHIAQPLIDQGLLAVVRVEPLYRPLWTVTRRDSDASAATPLVTRLGTLLSGIE